MAGQDNLDSLRDLHQDLIALSESRLANIERLCVDLEAHIDEFKRLLDKPPRNDASRSIVLSGALRCRATFSSLD